MLKKIGDFLERVGFLLSERFRKKPKGPTDRELQEILRQQRFERYVLGTMRAE